MDQFVQRVLSHPVPSLENIPGVAHNVCDYQFALVISLRNWNLFEENFAPNTRKAYTVKIVQEIKPHARLMLFHFAHRAEDRRADEGHSHIARYVCKQDSSISWSENPHVTSSHWRNQYPQIVTDCLVRFWYRGIIGPFLFSKMTKKVSFLFPKIEKKDIADIWFQQNGANCHTTNITLDLLSTVYQTNNQSKLWCILAASELWFVFVELFLLEVDQGQTLLLPTREDWYIKTWTRGCHRWSRRTYDWKCTQKLLSYSFKN